MSTSRSQARVQRIQLLLEALYLRYHFDFRHYAKASIKRRLRQARDQLGFVTFSAMQEKLLDLEGEDPLEAAKRELADNVTRYPGPMIVLTVSAILSE